MGGVVNTGPLASAYAPPSALADADEATILAWNPAAFGGGLRDCRLPLRRPGEEWQHAVGLRPSAASTASTASATAAAIASTVGVGVASAVASTVGVGVASVVTSVVTSVVASVVASAFAIAFDAALGLTRRNPQRGSLARPVGRRLGRSPATHCLACSPTLTTFSPAAHRLTCSLTRCLVHRFARCLTGHLPRHLVHLARRAALRRAALPERYGTAHLLTVARHGCGPLDPLGSREHPWARRTGTQSPTVAQGDRGARYSGRRPLGNFAEAAARTLALVEEGA